MLSLAAFLVLLFAMFAWFAYVAYRDPAGIFKPKVRPPERRPGGEDEPPE